jgi:hypothetical protein
MKGDRTLRLVPPAPLEGDVDAPPTAEELREAEALRLQLEGGDTGEGDALGLIDALRGAASPTALDATDHDAILARVLGADESAATSIERTHAEALRSALEGGAPTQSSQLARALRSAHAPTPLHPARNELLVAQALGRSASKPRRVLPVTMAALAGLAAIAAAVTLMLMPEHAPSGAATAALIQSRSSEDLFDATQPFPRSGGETARIDRIASARATDLRNNRFAKWGVR